MHLDDITVFLAVAKEHSFTKAGRLLDLPKSTVSERIARLEKSLGVRLFDRSSRSLELTESGAEYRDRVGPLVDGLEEANAAVTAAHRAPRGLLRVGAPLLVAQSFLAELVAEFLERYPDIAVELVLQENAASFDLIRDRLDLAIHVFGYLDPLLVVRKLGVTQRVLVSAHPVKGLNAPEDVPKFPAVVVGASRKMKWSFVKGRRRVDVTMLGRYAVTSIDLVHRAIVKGIGLGVLPAFVCAEDLANKKLVRLLPEWQLEDATVQVVYPSNNQISARTRAFADLLIERAAEKIASLPRV